MKSGKKVFGVGDAPYKTPGQNFGSTGYAKRKKIDAKKLELIRAWKENLANVLKVGTGLDIHLDTAMRELVEELQKWEEDIAR